MAARYAAKVKIPTYVIPALDIPCRDRGFQVSGKDMYKQGQHLPIERAMHAPQQSHIWPGYRYSSLSLQSFCETILQDAFPQASLPQGTDRHCCAAMCITAKVSKQNTTCKNGIRL